ncbi:MAG: hypothetical protein ABJF23_33310 [Bryobacteraceae bacterium]
MNRLNLVAVATCLTLASLSVAPAVADTWNKKTIITISEAVQVPGAILEPGKYVMKLLDSPSDRHIVQIFNEREDHIYTTILAIPNYRLQPTGKTEFQWWETPAGQPKAMRAWFYPGDNFGQEFAYPKSTAMQIAKMTNEKVVTMSQSEDLSKATVNTVDNSGNEAELNKETYTQAQVTPAPAPAPEPVVIAQNRNPEPTPEPAPVAAPEATRARTEELPHTASPFPLAGLAGFFALGTSVAIRALSKKAA